MNAHHLYLLLSENNQRMKEFKGKVLIINTSLNKDLKYHFELGQKLAIELADSEKRFAIIASAELSHCLTRNAPGGFFQKANLFDDKTIENLKKGKEGSENILNTDLKLAMEAKECGLRPIALMLGIINNLEYSPETLSYQKDLGIGYLTMKHYG
jgi:AmmeMemoRadiSam system protein B